MLTIKQKKNRIFEKNGNVWKYWHQQSVGSRHVRALYLRVGYTCRIFQLKYVTLRAAGEVKDDRNEGTRFETWTRKRSYICRGHVPYYASNAHVRYQTCTDAIITPNLITLSAISDRARQKSLVSTLILETDKTACSLMNTFPPNYFNLPSVTKSRSWIEVNIYWLLRRIGYQSGFLCTSSVLGFARVFLQNYLQFREKVYSSLRVWFYLILTL